nr:transcriptional repressor p66 alpha-like isoform X1 [Oncorhynchus nerka]XP_029479132.1 transcriptional repressor p66 alpha-like isoform X1 [Oncorhynchus nerka]XP_029479133.1 transcriptional repressor p66 alpha-like isoform X1 [Oncorhynchus nerka]XP_029479134.1 transcriptional repressor p66 alpha-like isoform X1 [Oncorhynchus nerka]XP_029479135.1 transcriptional repressor p66 alpha-like isoform X1 [Oncorhynchus nerka]
MSEEAVRQTRSQKRALVREVPPTESDRKKPKLERAETGAPDQDDESSTNPKPQPETTKDDLDQFKHVVMPEKAPELPKLKLSLVLPSQPAKEPERDWAPKRSDPSLDNRTERNDHSDQVRVKSEVPLDGRNRTVKSEPMVASGMMTATEVKATIKVEVQTREQALDMSTSRGTLKREKCSLSPDDDVIVLSDNDSCSPPMNGLNHFKELNTDLLMKTSPEDRDRIIMQLKEELRQEEAKLVLLKKLRQSQIQKDTVQKVWTHIAKPSVLSGSAAPPSLIRGSITASKGSQQVGSSRSSGTVIPPPLVRGGQQISSKHGSHNSQIIMPPLVRGAQPIAVSPQQIQSLRQQQQQQLSGSGSGGSGPPPLLLASRANVPGPQAQRGLIRVGNVNNASLLVNISQASATNVKVPSMTSQSGNSSVSVVNVNDSPAACQAAAKQALRKQLEKTLLEIPPPKPPTPELNFLPSAANNEFIYLVGLEDVVQNLLDSMMRAKTGKPPVKPSIKEPFTCTQCSTDFTCRWRQDKAKGGTILCADCMSSNQKKALKAEHTNRLKAAFVKALQQEQEIEQQILQQAAAPVSHTLSSSFSSSSTSPSVKAEHLVSQQLKQAQAQARASSLHHHHQQHNRGQSIARHHSTNIKQGQLSRGGVPSVGVRGVSHSFSSSQLQSAVAAAGLVSRPGKHAHVRSAAQGSKGSSSGNSSSGSAQATAWRKQNNINTGVTMAYVNPSLPVHKTSSTVDARQREYLLDMIPSRSISQTANTWK